MDITEMKRKMMDAFWKGQIIDAPASTDYYSAKGNIWNTSILDEELTINLRVFSDYSYSYHVKKSILELVNNGKTLCSIPITTDEMLEMRRRLIENKTTSVISNKDNLLAMKLIDEFLASK